MARNSTGRRSTTGGRPYKGDGPSVHLGNVRLDPKVAGAFFAKAKALGLNKTDAVTEALAAFAGVPLDRQEVIPLA